MQDESWKSELGGQVRTLQIISAAMILGPLFFAAIAVGAVLTGSLPAVGTEPLLTYYVGLGIAVVALLVRAVVPDAIAKRGRSAIAAGEWEQRQTPDARNNPANAELIERTGDAGRLMAVYMTRGIVGMALLEGACFTNLVIYMVEQQPLSLAVAAVLLAVLAIGFPTRQRVVDCIEQQLRHLRRQGRLDT